MGLQNIKYIVPAVRSIRAKSSSSSFVRHSPRLDYAKARQRWWIHVDFNSDIDLCIFEKAVTGSEVRLVELKETFYVEDPRIPDTANMAEASHLAEAVIAQLNGATQVLCPHFVGVRIESMIELLDNGTGRGIVSCPITLHGSSTFSAIGGFLSGPSAPMSSILAVAKSNTDVKEALYYLGAEGNPWANLYKASEVVEDHTGGAKILFHNGWCSRSAWERFRRTANHQEAIGRFSRHARSQAEPPPDPMTPSEARQLVLEVVKLWIESLIGTQDGKTKD